jgi:hypothetical protein
MLSVVAFGGLAITDWPSGALSSFWSDHAMLTNLVSSAIFAVVTVTVIEAWLRQREDRQKELLRRAEEHRLTIVRSAAYNAVARAPIAQRRIMWFLVHGGELRRVPEFEISEEHVRELRTMLARLELPETSEHSVMLEGLARPSFSSRFPVLAQDRQWRQLVHDVLLDVVHNFRVLVARWSALLVTTDESLRALRDLAAQAEELSRIFVEFNGNKPACGVPELGARPLTSDDRRSSTVGHDRRRVAAPAVSDLPADTRTGPADGPHVLHQGCRAPHLAA